VSERIDQSLHQKIKQDKTNNKYHPSTTKGFDTNHETDKGKLHNLLYATKKKEVLYFPKA